MQHLRQRTPVVKNAAVSPLKSRSHLIESTDGRGRSSPTASDLLRNIALMLVSFVLFWVPIGRVFAALLGDIRGVINAIYETGCLAFCCIFLLNSVFYAYRLYLLSPPQHVATAVAAAAATPASHARGTKGSPLLSKKPATTSASRKPSSLNVSTSSAQREPFTPLSSSTISSYSRHSLASSGIYGSPFSTLSRTPASSSRSAVDPLLGRSDTARRMADEMNAANSLASTPSSFSPSASMLLYGGGYTPSPLPAISNKKDTKMGEDAQIQAAEVLLNELGMAPYMAEWTDRLRQWLVAYVLKPIVNDIAESDRAGLSSFATLIPVTDTRQVGVNGAWGSSFTQKFGNYDSTPIAELMMRHAQEPIVQRRARLEQYLNVLGCASREYLVKRIKELAQGSCVQNFKWNAGGLWQNKSPDGKKPFSTRYFAVYPDSASRGVSPVIYQDHIHPPHFVVKTEDANGLSMTLTTIPGRHNLFHAIIHFVYQVEKRFSGYLQGVNLRDSKVNLCSVIE